MEGALARTTTPDSTFEETCCYKLISSQNTNVTFSLDVSLLGRRAVGPRSRRRGTPASQDQDLSDGQIFGVFSKWCDAMVFHGFWLAFTLVQGIFNFHRISCFCHFLSLIFDFLPNQHDQCFLQCFWGSLTIVCDFQWLPNCGPAMRCLRCTAQVCQNQNVLMTEFFGQDPTSRIQNGDRRKVVMEENFVWPNRINITIFIFRSNLADSENTWFKRLKSASTT